MTFDGAKGLLQGRAIIQTLPASVGILEYLSQFPTPPSALGQDGGPLCFQTETRIGLLVSGHADVPNNTLRGRFEAGFGAIHVEECTGIIYFMYAPGRFG